MRLFLTVIFLTPSSTFAQKSETDACVSQLDSLAKEIVYKTVEQMPTVNEGIQQIFKEVSKRIKYLSTFDNYPIESKIFVAFVVTNEGGITGQRIIKNINGTDFAEQLLEILSEFKWQPGICNGNSVPTIMVLPMIVDFK